MRHSVFGWIVVFAVSAGFIPLQAKAAGIEQLRASGEYLDQVDVSAIRGIEVPAVTWEIKRTSIITPAKINGEIVAYQPDSFYRFKREALEAMNDCVSNFQAARIPILSADVTKIDGGDYSFIIEYIDDSAAADRLASLSVHRYESPANYRYKSTVDAAMNRSVRNFRAAGLPVIHSGIIKVDREYTFAVECILKNVHAKDLPGSIEILRYVSNDEYSTNRKAAEAMKERTRSLKNAGIAVFHSYVTATENNDYSFIVAFAARKSPAESKPRFVIMRYNAEDIYPYKSSADRGKKERADAFRKAGINIVDDFVYERPDRDYSFSLSYLRRNIAYDGAFYDEFSLMSYQSGASYRFESLAKRAMNDTVANLKRSGIPVISSRVVRIANSNYSFVIEYIAKSNISGYDSAPVNYPGSTIIVSPRPIIVYTYPRIIVVRPYHYNHHHHHYHHYHPAHPIIVRPPRPPVHHVRPPKPPKPPVHYVRPPRPTKPPVVVRPRPTKPTRPVVRPRPTKPTRPVVRPRPTKPTRPVVRPRPTKPTRPVVRPRPTKPTRPVVRPRPTKPTRPVVRPRSTKPTRPTARPSRKDKDRKKPGR